MPVDRSQLNAVGDIVVSDPHALRALADPVTLRLFDLVRRRGPATASELARAIGEDDESVRVRLTAMETANLIDVDHYDHDRWSTPAAGIYFEIPEKGEDAQMAARALSNVMFSEASELPTRWIEDAEQHLTLEWARAAGLFNARIELTPDELRQVQDAIDQLLEPFNTRGADRRPSEAATVRILAFFMPEPAKKPSSPAMRQLHRD